MPKCLDGQEFRATARKYEQVYRPSDRKAETYAGRVGTLNHASGGSRIFATGVRQLVTGGGRGQWFGGIMASAEHEPITGVWRQGSGGQSPPQAESILFIGCPTEPANLAPVRENSMLCYGPLVPELGGPECMVHTVSKYSYKSDASAVST